jgi:hypothetical protein
MLDWMLENRSGTRTPTPLKVAVIVQGLLVLPSLASVGPIDGSILRLASWSMAFLLAFAVLAALWNLKRWAVIVLAANAARGTVAAIPRYLAASPHGAFATPILALLLVLVTNVGLVAGVVYWRRMTWK